MVCVDEVLVFLEGLGEVLDLENHVFLKILELLIECLESFFVAWHFFSLNLLYFLLNFLYY